MAIPLAKPPSAPMAKRAFGHPFGHPLRGAYMAKERDGRPLWAKGEAPTWPNRREGGSFSASLAIPHLREAGAYMAIPSGWGGPYGQKEGWPSRWAKSIWPSPPFGLWESGSLWP
jgi:hypothetical protein